MIKKIAVGFFRVLIASAYCVYKIEGINALLLIMPAKLIAPTLRKYGAVVGKNPELHSPLMIHNAGKDYSNLILGDDVYMGRGVFLDLKDRVIIQDRVTVSMKAVLLTHTDAGKSKVSQFLTPSHSPVLIKNDVYIGASAVITEGAEIGESSVVGACSLVRGKVAARSVVAGVPAKEIKKLSA